MKRAREYGLPDPEFLEIGDTFRVVLYRPDPQKPIKKADKKPIIQEHQQKIISYLEKNGEISNREARELLDLADSTIKRILKQMVQEELLKEQGERRLRVYKLR